MLVEQRRRRSMSTAPSPEMTTKKSGPTKRSTSRHCTVSVGSSYWEGWTTTNRWSPKRSSFDR
jgi:hypothetical protein